MKLFRYFLIAFLLSANCFASAKINDFAELKVKTFDGKIFDLAEQKGKIVIVNFWASWCSQCRKEILVLEKIQQKYGEKNLVIIGIATDAKAQKLAKTIKYQNASFSSIIKGNLEEPDAVPTPYIINKEGKIYAILDDENLELNEAEFDKILMPLLKKSASS